jgi:hypothetical protein
MNGLPVWMTVFLTLGGPTLAVAVLVTVNEIIKSRASKKQAKINADANVGIARTNADGSMSLEQVRAEAARAAAVEADDRYMNASMRVRIEAHLPWDWMIRSTLQELQAEVNELRQENGHEPRQFPLIPPPPPLFPPPRDAD